MRNNLVTALNNASGVSEDHNITFSDPSLFFMNAAGFDFHLLETSAAVDTGAMEFAPALDLERIARPQGAGYEVGAYEWHPVTVMPTDAGVGPSDAGAPGSDAGVAPQDAGSGDAGGVATDAGTGGGDSGGCSCNVRGGGVFGGLALALLILGQRRLPR